MNETSCYRSCLKYSNVYGRHSERSFYSLVNHLHFTSILAFLICFGFVAEVQAQCEIDQLISINDNNSTSINIEVDGASINDLADPLQGLCKVAMSFSHDAIGQLECTLISPTGQQVQLIGSAGLNNEITQNLEWDICFLSDDQIAMPDPGQPANWNNSIHVWPLFSPPFTGSYYPASGTFDDFSFGPVNGTWTLQFNDVLQTQSGFIDNIVLTFCDVSILDCTTCHTEPIEDVTVQIDPIGCIDNFGNGTFGQAIISSSESFIEYEWIGPGGIILDQALPAFVSPGTYYLTATNEAGCVYLDTIEMIWDPALTDLVFENIELSCTVGSGFFYQSGDLSAWNIEWSGPGIVDPSIENPEIFDEGIYNAVATNVNDPNCFLEFELGVTMNGGAEVDLTASGELGCSIETVTIIANTMDMLQSSFWTSVELFTQVNDFEIEVTEPGKYYFVSTDLTGCMITDSVCIEEIMDNVSVSVLQEILTINCDITEVQLLATSTDPTLSLDWTDELGNPYSGDAPFTTEGGKYYVTVESVLGCLSTDSLTVVMDTFPPELSFFPTMNLNLTCIKDSINLNAFVSQMGSNFMSYWIDPNGNQFFENPITAKIPGFWKHEVIAENGCDLIDSIEIIDLISIPEIELDGNFLIDCDNTTASITANSPNNIADYLWEGPGILSGNGSSTIVVSAGGTYYVTVTDVFGCMNNDSTLVNVTNDFPLVDVSISDTLSCNVNEVCIEVISNLTIASVDWQGPGPISIFTTNKVAIIEPGMYTVAVEAENGCISTVVVDMPLDTIKPIVSGVTDTINCEFPIAEIFVQDNVLNPFYNWTGPEILNNNVSFQTVGTEGDYFVTITNLDNGCESELTLNVHLDVTEPVIQLDVPDLPCDGTPVQISVMSDVELSDIEWTTPDMQLLTALEPMVNLTGVYVLNANGPNGCMGTAMINLEETNILPEFDFTTANISCAFPEATICALDTEDDLSLQWYDPNGNQIGSATCLDVIQPGDYELEVIGQNGCSAVATVNVGIIMDGLDVDILQLQDVICDMQIVSLMADIVDDGTLVYSWETTNGEIVGLNDTQTISVNGSGIYELTVSSALSNCDGFASIIVNELPSTITDIDLIKIDPDCFGDSNGLIEILDVNGAIPPLMFRLDSLGFSEANVFSGLAPGVYELEVIDSTGCNFIEEVTIGYGNDLDVTIGDDRTIMLGDSIDVEAIVNIDTAEIDHIVWQSTFELPCDSCYFFNVFPMVDGFVKVSVMDENGCVAEDEIFINIESPEIHTANIFTPNGDGKNDEFVAFADQGIKNIIDFRIYDRWGNLVHDFGNFQPSDFSASWDGYLNGSLAESGVYAFTIEAETLVGEILQKTGTITLLR